MTIAIDFDGTIVEHRYPKIGKPIPFAIETLLQLQKENHKLILWTVREGDLLQEAIDYCSERGLNFYAANANYPEEKDPSPRKINVDMFVDDRNLGGLPDWGVIYKAIQATADGENSFQTIMSAQETRQERKRRKKNIFLRIGEALDAK
ncbi:MAG TPA: hypothetical protein VLZ33_05250 [Dysgonamonadaceae bacterium]|nr:hypothetical protein [Dysgonamonadaceae bacterium]